MFIRLLGCTCLTRIGLAWFYTQLHTIVPAHSSSNTAVLRVIFSFFVLKTSRICLSFVRALDSFTIFYASQVI